MWMGPHRLAPPWNIPYHAEHHLYPSIPFHRLTDAHAASRARPDFVQRGYVRWHLGLLRRLHTAPGA
jgi:fatty acid desaturase